MKRSRVFSMLFALILLVMSVVAIAPASAQEVTHDTIIAAIPDLEHFAEQAEQTFVGDVEGSYAYIAFVIQGNLAVIYVCDGYDSWGWIRAEVVNGEIHATHEETGIQVDAVVTAEGVSGTVVLAIDDDGTPAEAHAFSTVPAVPGETGLARYADEDVLAGWIVTDEGVRGIKKSLQCAGYRRQVESLRLLMNNTSDAAVRSELAGQIIDTNLDAIIAGCENVAT
jgi:hypothetical protein